MKKIFCFSLSLLILTISILVYCPLGVFASYPDDYFSLSKPYTDSMGLSSSDAQAAVNAHKDIADSNGILCFQYTPTDTYNWTMNTKKQKIHLSDNQLKNLLMSKHSLSHGFLEFIYGASNSNAYRGFISSVGVATKTDSDTLLGISDKITGNYNYLNAIDYNEDTQTITMSNDNASVDKLREEIKLQYYRDNGMFYIGGSLNKPTDIIKSSWYDDMTLYQEDYNAVSNYDFAIGSDKNAFYFNSSDYSYIYLYLKTDSYFGSGTPYNNASVWWQFTDNNLNPVTLPNYTKSLNCTEYTSTKEYNMNYNEYAFRFYTWYSSNVRGNYSERLLNNIKERVCIDTASTSYGINPHVQWKTENLTDNSYYDYISSSFFYAKSNKTFVGFTSYDALFDYVHGESSAYLGSAINKVGEDITFSIKDMNENIGSKMDTLIDTINDKKGSMSADELQNAIDKGLEDLNKTSEDIKDNTEEMNSKLDSILEALNAQNQTLLAILGVTKKIADTVDDIDEKTDYNSIISTISTIFNAVQCALLYGQNTLKDSDSSAQAQAVSYSDDDIAVYSDSGGTYKPKVLNMDLRSGIFGHFPFSMIYHMYDWCAAFVAEAKAPVFTYNYGFLVGDKDNPELTVSIDLSQYEDWRNVAASFMRLSFTLAVAYGSYKRFKEEML